MSSIKVAEDPNHDVLNTQTLVRKNHEKTTTGTAEYTVAIVMVLRIAIMIAMVFRTVTTDARTTRIATKT